MEQLIVKVDDQEKAQMLSKILTALDFVNSVEIIEYKAPKTDDDQDFFSLAGLWENRNITTDSLRAKAWKENEQ
ncbi:MAG TPA: hypothetical protein V6C58_08385 [Allocoleopsis sp.]